jgi:hypothetical protein
MLQKGGGLGPIAKPDDNEVSNQLTIEKREDSSERSRSSRRRRGRRGRRESRRREETESEKRVGNRDAACSFLNVRQVFNSSMHQRLFRNGSTRGAPHPQVLYMQ